ncbi:hypothetical protein F1C10_13730 [Sphingomonas sp. NBWT7]|uniref:hypothetical protein n=1 Tax=Sphingomonas sp. NBWT7 TaxID=2596913 RepID=UPI00185FCC1D|nr:hypothetical protein [Sphingomonas sp. NBWT7]QNE32881.1 hypothetical protein F1C10_13730 [Sphingomonas sp. NBWT7]
MSARGRPLRFLVVMGAGWIGVRSALLWPDQAPLPALATVVAPPALAETTPRPLTHPRFTARQMTAVRADIKPPPASRRPATPQHAGFLLPPSDNREPSPSDDPAPPSSIRAQPFTAIAAPLAPPPPDRAATTRSRFAASVWTILRDGGSGQPFAPQLGGSQAGARVTYALGDARRLALAARVSTAIGTRQQEAAIGLDWQPTRLPIHIVAEQRIGVQRARGGPALGVIAGIGPAPITGALTIDAYAQGGAIARDGVEGYVDAAARVAHPIARVGQTRLDLGVGAWGGAQRGASRLDLGPSVTLAVPLSERVIRLSLDWRQRVAGDARPASGPALSIGTDF